MREAAGQGVDTVRSTVTYNLTAQSPNIEHLTLLGTGDINGVGNGLNNNLTGNNANNLLNGVGGADRMSGLSGDDIYIVDNAGDRVIEGVGRGHDTVRTVVNYALSAQSQNIEDLVLLGSGNIAGVGNNAANTITGNNGNNSLNGLGGNDTLNGFGGNDRLTGGNGNDIMSGGTGDDLFVFVGVFGSDEIGDFSTVEDRIDLSGVNAIMNFADLTANHLSEVDGNAVITSGTSTITLTGVLEANLAANDFLF